MPGNYTHEERAIGLVLTAAIYNADHVQHVNNRTPDGLASPSPTVLDFHLTQDPGTAGNEILPETLEEELRIMRWCLQKISGASQWHLQIVVELEVENDTLSVQEGNSVNIRVRLSERPAFDVTVVASDTSPILALEQSSRTFTPDNWNVYQNFSVLGIADANVVSDTATVTLQASGGSRDSGSVRITVTEGASTRIKDYYRRATATPDDPTDATFGAFASLSGWQGANPGPTTTLNVYRVRLTQYFNHATTQDATTFNRNEYSSPVKVADNTGTSTRTKFYYRRASTTPTAPTAATFAAFSSITGWQDSNPGPTATLNVYRVQLTQHFNHRTTQDADTFDRNAYGAVAKVADAVPIITRQTRTIYTLSSSTPSAPAGGTATAAFVPAGWQTSLPDSTTSEDVYSAQRTETFSNNVFQSATVYGGVTRLTSTRTRTIYRRDTSTPSAPAGGTTTANFIPAGWQSNQPDPTNTQNVYRATRTETFTSNTFTFATTYGSVTKVADKTETITTRQRHIYRLSGAAPSDFNLASANGNPQGITTDGTYFYVVDWDDNHAYVYTLAGARQTTREFTLLGDNTSPQSITTDGTYFYIADSRFPDHVYVYTIAGARQTTREFNLVNVNGSPQGITTDDTYLYVVDSADAHVYVYTLAGARQTSREFALHNDNSNPQGITTDGTYLYVADSGDDKVFVYTLAGAQQSTRDFNLHNDNGNPSGLTTDGTYFYVVDGTDDKVYAYNPTGASEVPTAPSGGTTTAAYIPSGWQATEPDPTSTQAVYRATRTETFTNGVFTSATVYGSVTKVADKVANTQTITLGSNLFDRNISRVAWIHPFNVFPPRPPVIDNALRTVSPTARLYQVMLFKSGQVVLSFSQTGSSSDLTRADLSDQFETNGGFTITAGNHSLTVALAGADRIEAYIWTPSNSDEVTAFYNAVTTATEATLVLSDNI